jgi:hypothetical protein
MLCPLLPSDNDFTTPCPDKKSLPCLVADEAGQGACLMCQLTGPWESGSGPPCPGTRP